MTNRFVQVYNNKVYQWYLVDRLKAKIVDSQIQMYSGVPVADYNLIKELY